MKNYSIDRKYYDTIDAIIAEYEKSDEIKKLIPQNGDELDRRHAGRWLSANLYKLADSSGCIIVDELVLGGLIKIIDLCDMDDIEDADNLAEYLRNLKPYE